MSGLHTDKDLQATISHEARMIEEELLPLSRRSSSALKNINLKIFVSFSKHHNLFGLGEKTFLEEVFLLEHMLSSYWRDAQFLKSYQDTEETLAQTGKFEALEKLNKEKVEHAKDMQHFKKEMMVEIERLMDAIKRSKSKVIEATSKIGKYVVDERRQVLLARKLVNTHGHQIADTQTKANALILLFNEVRAAYESIFKQLELLVIETKKVFRGEEFEMKTIAGMMHAVEGALNRAAKNSEKLVSLENRALKENVALVKLIGTVLKEDKQTLDGLSKGEAGF